MCDEPSTYSLDMYSRAETDTLTDAIDNNDLAVMRQLLEEGEFGVNVTVAGLTMLMRAVDVGNAEAVVMIRNHCSFDPAKSERNQHQQTVFHLINDRNLDCMDELLPLYGDLINERDNRGLTPLQVALDINSGAHFDEIEWFLDNGASPQSILEKRVEKPIVARLAHDLSLRFTKLFVDRGIHLLCNTEALQVTTLMHLIIKARNLKPFSYLLQNQTKLFIENPQGQTHNNLADVAIRAIRFSIPESVEIARRVVEASAEPPSFGVLYEFFVKYFGIKDMVTLKNTGFVRSDGSIEMYPLEFRDDLTRILISSFANANTLKRGEVARIRFNRNVDNEALQFLHQQYSFITLVQVAANSVRKILVDSGHGNLEAALESERVDQFWHNDISLKEVRRRYSEKLEEYLAENSNSKRYSLGPYRQRHPTCRK